MVAKNSSVLFLNPPFTTTLENTNTYKQLNQTKPKRTYLYNPTFPATFPLRNKALLMDKGGLEKSLYKALFAGENVALGGWAP